MIRGANDGLSAYRTTTVPIHESQADVRALLRDRRATGMQISEAWSGEDSFADLRFALPAEAGGLFAYRIRVRVPTVDQVLDQARRAKVKLPPEREARARGERQIWRLVYWWLKAQFEAADAGLVSLEEAFLPWMELPDGRTTYEAMAASGGLAQIASGTLPLLTGGTR